MARKNFKYIVGIDEAGRGPLAGPVAVGAVCIPAHFNKNFFNGIADSKQLSQKQREEWFGRILEAKKKGELDFAVSYCESGTIDRIGITASVKRCIQLCLKKLSVDKNSSILLDGLLKAPANFKHQKTIIRGDESEPVISLASIAAKVLRDERMRKLGKKYPGYSFENNKGYGTRVHIKEIRRKGPCAIHRMSFLKGITGN